MSEQAFDFRLRFHTIVCCTCGTTFAVDADLRQRWLDKGLGFWCPNGHSQHYSESRIQKLEKELAAAARDREFYRVNAAAEREARERTEKRLAAQRGHATRLRRRIKNGVCPCCTRSFQNLQRHIASQHPDFQAEPPAT